MWHWDQGHLAYFQFDDLRKIAKYVTEHDFKSAAKEDLRVATGLPFRAPETHSAWRNYSRTLKIALLVREFHGRAEPTPVALALAQPGKVTCDEYLHFLACSFTEPSPALQDWQPSATFRYPLLFALKYLLTKTRMGIAPPSATLAEIVGAYGSSGFVGDEREHEFGGRCARRCDPPQRSSRPGHSAGAREPPGDCTAFLPALQGPDTQRRADGKRRGESVRATDTC